ncbi:MAG: TIGR04255 family protein [Planctomycetes bacterium]|nr:TIGR04255 family protein [Planctomycetota bacterium]
MPSPSIEDFTVHFENSPVVETALGVQFAALSGMTSGHMGWFWKRYLDDSWTGARDAPELLDQFERFGDPRLAAGPLLQLIVSDQPRRLQISSAADDRVIQVQRSRFLYNWRRREQAYPRHEIARAEFIQHWAAFTRFVKEAKLGELAPNQWEVTYVNHLPQGGLWQSPGDWPRILPGLIGRTPGESGLRLESLASDWHMELEPRRGRLHASVKHGRTSAGEVLVFQLTARGPVGGESSADLFEGIALGHRAIVRCFVNWTSAEAHQAWGRRSACQ